MLVVKRVPFGRLLPEDQPPPTVVRLQKRKFLGDGQDARPRPVEFVAHTVRDGCG